LTEQDEKEIRELAKDEHIGEKVRLKKKKRTLPFFKYLF